MLLEFCVTIPQSICLYFNGNFWSSRSNKINL